MAYSVCIAGDVPDPARLDGLSGWGYVNGMRREARNAAARMKVAISVIATSDTQCDIRVGTVIDSSISRVTPPNMASVRRDRP